MDLDLAVPGLDEICVAGTSGVKRCTHTCCTNRDCTYDWAESCRPPFYGSHAVGDPSFADMAHSLGRTAFTLAGSFAAIGVSPLCMPR